MKKQSNLARCKECKLEVHESELRDHWFECHEEKLKAIDRWLGRTENKAREWERVVRIQEGEAYESK